MPNDGSGERAITEEEFTKKFVACKGYLHADVVQPTSSRNISRESRMSPFWRDHSTPRMWHSRVEFAEWASQIEPGITWVHLPESGRRWCWTLVPDCRTAGTGNLTCSFESCETIAVLCQSTIRVARRLELCAVVALLLVHYHWLYHALALLIFGFVNLRVNFLRASILLLATIQPVGAYLVGRLPCQKHTEVPPVTICFSVITVLCGWDVTLFR